MSLSYAIVSRNGASLSLICRCAGGALDWLDGSFFLSVYFLSMFIFFCSFWRKEDGGNTVQFLTRETPSLPLLVELNMAFLDDV